MWDSVITEEGQSIDAILEDLNRAEVKEMCLTEYNEAETVEMIREEGRQETRLLDIKNLMDTTGWTASQVMDVLKIPTNQRAILYANLSRIK